MTARHLIGLVFSLLLVGCPADPLDPITMPDGAPPELDRGAEADVTPPDAEVVPTDAGPDAAPDLSPPPDLGPLPPLPPDGTAPESALTAVLVGRQDTWVAYVIARRLYGVRLDPFAAVDGVPGEAESMVLGGVPAGVSAIDGVRAPNGRPWALVADGGGGMARAHDVTGALAPLSLGLWPPLRTAVDGDRIVVVGRSGPADDAPIALVELGDDGPSVPIVDPVGVTLPATVAPGQGGWVFGFDDGICQVRAPDIEAGVAGPERMWRCATRAGAVLSGHPLAPYVVGEVDGHVRAWTATPGAAQVPLRAPMDGDQRAVTVAVDARAESVHDVPGGRVLRVVGPDVDALVVAGTDELHWLPADRGAPPLGAVSALGEWFQVVWNARLARPVLVAAADVDGPPAPDAAADCAGSPSPIPQPEQCRAFDVDGAHDYDCTGADEDGRCCLRLAPAVDGRTALDVSSDDPTWQDVPVSPWFVANAPGGLTFIAAYGDRLDLVRFREGLARDNEAPDALLARFEGVARIERFAGHAGRFVVHGHPPAADGETPEHDAPPGDLLAWYLGREPAPGGDGFVASAHLTASPCVPVMRVWMTAEHVRVYCPDGAWDVPYDAAGPDFDGRRPVAYPVETVRWMGPPLVDGADEVYLVGDGPAHTLSVWRDTAAGGPIATERLPARLAVLPPDDRDRPFRLPEGDAVLPARVVDGRVEVHLPELGWRPGPAGRWPIDAQLSSRGPLALTVALTEDPDKPGAVRDALSVVLQVHSLRAGELHWGQPVDYRGGDAGASVPGRFVHGLRFADHAVRAPVIWSAYGDPGRIEIRPVGVDCTPFDR